MKIQAAVMVVSLWMGMGAESVFATTWDSCDFGEQDGQSEIFLKSDRYAGRFATSFSVDALDEASKPVEYYFDVEYESNDIRVKYFANDDFSLQIFWKTCARVDGAFKCEARLELEAVNGGKAVDGYCEIQHKYTPQRPPVCRPGMHCH